jgi:hypothetical protein
MSPPPRKPLPDPAVPWKPDEQAAGSLSSQCRGNATAAAITPPPSKTKLIAVEDLMTRA